MTPALEIYLAEVEAAEGRMTDGPWETEGPDHQQGIVHVFLSPKSGFEGEHVVLPGHSALDKEDAHGIALLRNRVKALCGMVRVMGEAFEAMKCECVEFAHTRYGVTAPQTCRRCRALSAVALIAKGRGARISTSEPLTL